jgi:hypothetical protein
VIPTFRLLTTIYALLDATNVTTADRLAARVADYLSPAARSIVLEPLFSGSNYSLGLLIA